MRHFIALSAMLVLFVAGTYGQAASSSWPLTADNIAVTTGNITSVNQASVGVGTNSYGTDGVGADDWATGVSPDAGKYYEFAVSPNTGYNLSITDISIDNNTDGISGTALIQFAFDPSFAFPVNLGSSFAVSTGAPVTTNFTGLSIVVNNSQTLYIRVFAWDIENSSKIFNARNFTINGSTVSCLPDIADFNTLTPTAVCESSPVTITVNSTSLLTDNYTVTYDLGGANTASGLSASLSFTSGTPGIGTFTVPAVDLVNTGNTTVTITSVTSSTSCTSPLSTGNSVAATVTALPVATFSYAGSPYCSNAVNPLPTFSGTAVAGTFSSTAGLVFVNTSTGEIDLAASTPGTYTVTNTIAAADGCGIVSATSDITITALPVATFSYTGSPYCLSAANPSPVFSGGGVAGTFSSTAGLVFVNTATGEIDIAASTPATYTITNSIAAADGCGIVTATSDITITDNNTIALSSAAGTDAQTVCINTVVTNITYSTTGATGASFTGLPAGVTGSWAANVVTISGTPTASGTFNYTVTLTGGCGAITANGSIDVTANNTVSLTSAGGTNAQTVCINTAIANITYSTTSATGASFTGLPAGVNGNWVGNVVTISGTPTASGTFGYTITTTGGCTTPAITATGTITVTANNTIAVSSGAGTNNQTRCINVPLSNITFATTGATGASITGLPAGVNGNWAGNVVTISGTPTASGTFGYTVTTTGGCTIPAVTATGTITVTANNTIAVSSGAGTNNQTRCINVPLSNITFTTTGATGASITGLPAGVNGNWAGNVVTISGTPTASGTFGYTVTTTGGCTTPAVTATGTITVTANNTITVSSGAGTNNQTKCINTALTNITFATTGATGATITGLPTGVNGNWAGNIVTISGTPTASGTFGYTVTTTGGCTTPPVTATGTITVTANNTVTLTSAPGTNAQTKCINTALTNITYATTGATGATFTGLPTGVTGNWTANVVTISGAPSVNGTFNYTVTLTGGCGAITATGSINVNTFPAAAGVAICQNGAGSLTSTAPCAAGTTATAGPNFAGTGATGGGTGEAWGSPTRVVANDNSYTSVDINNTSEALNATQFGFAIPANAVINGIRVTIGRYGETGNDLQDNSVRLLKAGVATGNNNGFTNTDWPGSNPASEAPANYGSTTDLWGTTWTPAQINATNFGVSLIVDNDNNSNRTAFVDYINVTVTYTIPGTLNWFTVSSGGTAIGSNSPFNPVGVAGSGLPNTGTAGTTTFYAECAASPGCRTAANFLINPLPTITGNLTVCIGLTTSLTGSASPAASNPWVSATPSVATVNSSGVVTGVAAGTSVITYTNNNGCSITATVTVSAPAITGTLSVCPGATTQLTGSGTAAASNPWTSSNTAVATVNNTGLVSGVSPGTTVITYTNNFGCSIPATVTVNANATIALTSAAATTSQTLCINTPLTAITYLVGGGGTGATTTGLPAGVSGSYNAGTKVYTISGTPTAGGTFNYTVTTTGPCIKPALTGTITVQANSAIARTSPAATTTQTVCINTAITNIVYTISGGATSANVTGLPAGVTGTLSGNTFTISGTPTTTAGSPFSYTVTATGPCVNASLSGTITVNADATIALNSAAATTSQTVCINTPITAITYLIGGSGTGATISGFPAGITGSYNAGTKVYTISGTPTTSGTFNYTVTTTGPCIKPALTGTLNVTANPTISLSSAVSTTSQTICTNTALVNITYVVGSTGTGATVTGLPAGVSGSYDNGTKVFTISGTPTVTGTFNYTVTTTGPCANPSLSGSIITLVAPVGILAAGETSGTTNNDNIICTGSPVIFTATAGFNAYNFKVNNISVQTGTSNIFSSSVLTNGASVTVEAANGANCGSTFGPVVITVNPLPAATLTTPSTNICAGDNITFTAGGGVNYAFRVNGSVVQSGPSNTFETAGLVNGDIVIVDVTNANGCTAASSPITITVKPLPSGALTASATELCSGSSATFTAPAGFTNYTFFIDGTPVQGPGVTESYTAAFTTPSVITVSATLNGCFAMLDTVAVNVNGLPSGALSATENSGTADDNIICAGSVVNFTATVGFAGYDFKVNNISVQNTASNIFNSSTLVNGDAITVEVNNGDGCKAIFNSIAVTVVAAPSGILVVSPGSTVCENDNVTFTATAGYTNYNFKVNNSTVQNGASNVFSSTGMINGDIVTVEVTNSGSCTTIFNTINITVSPAPTTTLVAVENSGNTINDGIICSGAQITFTAPAGFTNYNFLRNGISVQNGASNTYLDALPVSGEQFEVAVTNAAGCIGLSNAVIITVNALPAHVDPITGNPGVCVNSTIILATATTSGVWSSQNPGIATIDPLGELSGIAAGNATIEYTVTNANGCQQSATAIITVYALPVVSPVTGILNVCTGSTRQLANATAGGVWSSSDEAIATIDAAGLVTGITDGTVTISYAVTNGNGCITTVTAVVSVNVLPVVAPVTIVSPAISFDVCEGETINLTSATTGGVWSITGTPGIASINGSGTVTGISDGLTTISYTVTSGNGCVNAVAQDVNVHGLPEPTLTGANPICPNSTEIYTTEPGQFNYLWSITGGTVISGGTTTDDFIEVTWDQPGIRSIFVNYQNSFGCSGITSATLTTTTGTVPTLSGPGVACLNTDGTYSTQPGETDYAWMIVGGTISSGGTSADNTATITWSTPGPGSVSINFTDVNGCTSANPTVKPVTVNPLPVIVTHNLSVCAPNTANLTAAGVTVGSTAGLTYTYWEDAEATIPYTTPTAAPAGVYYIKGTLPATGCFDIKPVTVSVNTPPSATINYTGSPFCTSGTPVLAEHLGSTGGTYSASPAGLTINAADGTITPASSSAGTYTITYTIAPSGGCSVYTTTASVTITAAPSATISYPGTQFCNTSAAVPVTRTGTPGGTYSASPAGLIIDPATGTVTPSSSTAGTYTIQYFIADAAGCAQFSTTTSLTISTPPSAAISYAGSPFCSNGSTASVTHTGTAGGTYTALPAGLSINSTTGAINIASSTAGIYTVKYTVAAANGCATFETTAPVTINAAPVANAGTAIPVCAPAVTVNITTGSSATNQSSITWTSNGTGVFANANSLTAATYTASAADISAGSRILTLTVNGNPGCAAAASTKTLTINPLPTDFTITPDAAVCLGDVVPLSASIGATTPGTVTVASSATLNLNIPDAGFFGGEGEVTTALNVAGIPAGAVINSININFNSNHNYAGDLVVNVTAPNGNTLNLINRKGGSGNGFNTNVSSASVTPITGGAPINGTFAADAANNVGGPTASNVTAYNSLFSTPNGNWVLNVQDADFHFGDGTGRINSWSITINYTTITPASVVWSPVTNLYTNSSLATAYSGQNLATVYAKTTAAGGFGYTATSTTGAGCTISKTTTLTVSPVPVVTVIADYCIVPGKVRLTASSVPAASSYIWSTGATTASIDVDIAGSYDVTAITAGLCPGKTSINVASELVTNGDFSLGNDGSFTSDYNYKPDLPGLVPAGQGELFDDSGNNGYSITTNGQNVHTGFWGLDHTNSAATRNFMAVNGHGNTLVVWKQTVPVQPNTTYYFSAWAMSLNSSGNYAQLRFSVNGTLVGTSAALTAHGESAASPDNWVRFYGTWTSGPTTTSAVIYINNLVASLGGNDFGLDDISFGSLSTFITLESAPGTDAQTVCRNTPLTNIIYNVGNGSPTGPTVTGLPAGVTNSFAGDILTINGTPAAAGIYTYTITTTGTCNPISVTGTITVQAPTITLSAGSATTNVCVNAAATAISYTLGGTATGATVTGLPTGMAGSVSGSTYTIQGTPAAAPGAYPFTITTTGGTCTQVTVTGTINVRSQTVALNSIPSTAAQTICINSPVTTIRYAVGGMANNASVSGLPPGVTGIYNTGFLTINGTPTSAAGSPYTYTVTTSGPSCSGATITGTITVTPAAGITLTSAAGTNNQNACNSLAITPITYSINNATGASITSGSLPAGVTGSFSAGVFTISGTPTAGGTFNYTITTSGGCASATASGTITVQAQTISLSSGIASPSLCANTVMTGIVFTVGGTATGATITGLPAGVTGTYSAGLFTISGTPTGSSGAYPYTVTTSGTCNPVTATGTITIQPTATGGNIASPVACSGGSGTLTLTGHSGTIVRWESSTDGGTTWNPITNTTITNSYTNITIPTLFRAVVGNGCGNVTSSTATVSIRNYWTGTVSADWNTAANWSGNMVPSTACANVIIPGGTPNQPVLNGGPVATITNLNILAGATLTVSNTGTLRIGGTISNTGIFDVSDGSLVFNGVSPQNIAGSLFKDSTLKNLTVSNPAGLSVSNAAGNFLKITGTLDFGVSNATLTTGDNIVLVSSASNTARVADITNNGVNSGNSFSGKVIVERFIPERRSWRLLTVPLQQAGSQTFNAAWQEGAVNPDIVYANRVDPRPGYGMLITGPTAATGFDPSPRNNHSVYQFNPSTLTWGGIPNTLSAKVTDSAGYLVFVRGDRATEIALNTAAPISNTILRANGLLKTNLQTTVVPAGIGAYSVVGNPYASTIDLRKVSTSGGVSGVNYVVWDPALTGVNGVGAYQYLTRTGGPGTDYIVFPGNSAAGGGSYGAAFSVNNTIQSGQAFLAQNAGAGTISINENAKVAPATSGVFRPSANTLPFGYISTLLLYGNGNTDSLQLADGALMMYREDYSNNIDLEDAKKMSNISSENFGVNSNGNWMQIEKRKNIQPDDTIFYKVKSYRVRDYQLKIEAVHIDQTGLTAYLEDNYLQTSTPVSLDGITIYNFTVTADSGAWRPDRLRIVFKKNVVLPVTLSSVKAYRNNDYINVDWKTEHELGIAKYEVERSADGIKFEKAFTELNVKNNDRGAVYSWIDKKPLTGFNFYRIRSVEMNGAVQYSTVVKVLLEKAAQSITLYPNPLVDGTFNLYFVNEQSGDYNLRLLNSAGQLIEAGKIRHTATTVKEIFKPKQPLLHGNYILEVTKPGGIKQTISAMY